MGKKTALKSCFISAPIAVDIGRLSMVLEDRGIQVKDALTLPPEPGSIIGAIETAIRDADFVCAVIPPKMSSNVLFEIGLAYGARKPLFLIVDKEADLPIDLKDIFYVRASPWDTEAIEFNLDNFLEHPITRVTRRQRIAEKESKPLLIRELKIDERLESLRGMEGSERAIAFENLVADLLRQTNAVVTQEERLYSDYGVDMAVWLDGIESSLGNPVLVEVKAGRLSKQRLRQAELQLQNYLALTNARVGLLIYFDQTGRQFPSPPLTWPLVIRFDLREFADLISKGKLVTALLKERNKAAHGRV